MAKQTFTSGQVLSAAQMTSLQQTAMGGGSATAKTASYVLTAADAGTTVIMNAAGATTITVNTGLFAAGDTVLIQNIGAGTTTVTAGTATVNTAGSLALGQYEGGMLYFTATGAAILHDYAQAGGSTPSYSLLSTTTLTGASTFTITGLSGYNQIYAIVENASASTVSQTLQARVNSSSSAIYSSYGLRITANNPYDNNAFGAYSSGGDTSIPLTVMSDSATSTIGGYIKIEGANSSGVKMWQSSFGANPGGSYYQVLRAMGGIIDTSSVISSFTLFFGSNFDNGTLRIYGSVA